jgi:alkylresorcinol/alkylpyrone synthase
MYWASRIQPSQKARGLDWECSFHPPQWSTALHATIKLSGLGLAVPDNLVRQADAADLVESLFSGRMKAYRHLAPIFSNSGIRKRYTVQPLSWFTEPHGWTERMQAYVEGASRLFVDAASRAIQQARLSAEDVDCVVTVSSTGFSVPSIEARVAASMGFRPDIERVPVFGLGCAGGVSGFAIASQLAAGRPGT